MNLIYAYFFVALMHNIIFYIMDAMILQMGKEELQKTSNARLLASIFWIFFDLITIIAFIVLKNKRKRKE